MTIVDRQRFGRALRQMREAAGIRLGEFARKLNVSASYLSDVELGNRQPFGHEKLACIATLLGAELTDLTVLAAESRGGFVLAIHSDAHRRAGRALMRRWHELDRAQLELVARLLEIQDDQT